MFLIALKCLFRKHNPTLLINDKQSWVKGNLSGDRGTIEMCVDWGVFGDSTGIGENNRQCPCKCSNQPIFVNIEKGRMHILNEIFY